MGWLRSPSLLQWFQIRIIRCCNTGSCPGLSSRSLRISFTSDLSIEAPESFTGSSITVTIWSTGICGRR
ncbi:MAG: hypothetical protein BWY89_01911 [Bacteroidetes bacterium ADurb.BinA012]|nr:MAG: hypothetical protein BWY89_01911 [Bacteroidetes bacterium ADurb.BinA012]